MLNYLLAAFMYRELKLDSFDIEDSGNTLGSIFSFGF